MTGSIRITTTEGAQTVEADVIGLLAIHPGVNGKDRWNLTHLPSGKAIVRDLAKEECYHLAGLLAHLDWSVSEQKIKQHYGWRVRAAYRQMKNGTRAA